MTGMRAARSVLYHGGRPHPRSVIIVAETDWRGDGLQNGTVRGAPARRKDMVGMAEKNTTDGTGTIDLRWRVAGDFLVRCIAAALRGERIPDDAGVSSVSDVSSVSGADKPDGPDDVTWAQVLALARFHNVEAVSWAGIPDAMRSRMPADVAKAWQSAADLTLFRQLSYDAEREAFLADFHAAGLAWLPLKGIVTATYYPQPGLRSMSDQDILFGFVEHREPGAGADDGTVDGNAGGSDSGWRFRGDDDAQRDEWARKADTEVIRIMEAHGYGKGHDWERELCFAKQGLGIEFHRKMVVAGERSAGYYDDAEMRYYANPWRLAVPDDEGAGAGAGAGADADAGADMADGAGGGGFHLRPEDEYVFHIAHMLKHYQSAGFGIRFLVDEVVFLRRFDKRFDWDRIQRALGELGFVDFERDIRELSTALFDHPDDWRSHVSDDQRLLFRETLESGVYGTQRGRVAKRMERERKAMVVKEKTGRMPADAQGYKSKGGGEGILLRWRLALMYGWRRIYPPVEWVRAYYAAWAGSPFTRMLLPFYRLYEGLRQHPHRLVEEVRALLRRQ